MPKLLPPISASTAANDLNLKGSAYAPALHSDDGSGGGGVDAHLNAVMSALGEGMVLRDKGGRVLVSNPSAERILGFPVIDLFSDEAAADCESPRDWLLVSEEREEFDLALMPDLLAIATGEAQVRQTLGIERFDGTVTWLSVAAAPLLRQGESEPYAAVMTFSDISEGKNSFDAAARLAAVVESSHDGIICATLDGIVVSWNAGAERLFGASAEETIGTMSPVLTPPNDLSGFKAIVKALLEGDGTEKDTCVRFRPDGTALHLSMTYSLIRGSSGEPAAVAAIARDVTERMVYESQIRRQMEQIHKINSQLEQQKEQLVLANEKLADLATLDGLTGLKNHRVFQERLLEEFTRAQRYKTPLSMFIMDIDHFKAYNDTHGHPAGDEILRSISVLLTDNCRATDIVARYGGEEFVVVLPQTGYDGAQVIAERCRARIEQHNWPLRAITASFGINTLTPECVATDEFLEGADKAMYQSKTTGKNSVTHVVEMGKAPEQGQRKAA